MSKVTRCLVRICSLTSCLLWVTVFAVPSQAPPVVQPVVGPERPEQPQAAKIRALNNNLLLLHQEIQQVTPSEAVRVRREAGTVIADRAAALAALVEYNPRQALSFAFSPELLVDLAAKFPQSAGLLEFYGTWQGPIEVWVADDFTGNRYITITKMRTGGQTLQLYFARGEPLSLQTGATLKTKGVLMGSKLIVIDEEVR